MQDTSADLHIVRHLVQHTEHHILETITDSILQELHILDTTLGPEHMKDTSADRVYHIVQPSRVLYIQEPTVATLLDSSLVLGTIRATMLDLLHILVITLVTSLDLLTTQATMLDLLRILVITLGISQVLIRIYMEVTSLETTRVHTRERILEQLLFLQKKLYQRLNCGLGQHKHGS